MKCSASGQKTPDKNPLDINPQTKPPGQRPPDKSPPEKTNEHKIYIYNNIYIKIKSDDPKQAEALISGD